MSISELLGRLSAQLDPDGLPSDDVIAEAEPSSRERLRLAVEKEGLKKIAELNQAASQVKEALYHIKKAQQLACLGKVCSNELVDGMREVFGALTLEEIGMESRINMIHSEITRVNEAVAKVNSPKQ